MRPFLLPLRGSKNWQENGAPTGFWLSAFFSPNAFVLAIQLSFSRKQGFAFNSLTFDCQVRTLKKLSEKWVPLIVGELIGCFMSPRPRDRKVKDCIDADGSAVDEQPDIGCLIDGLFLDGAAWSSTNHHLIESRIGVRFESMPPVSGGAGTVETSESERRGKCGMKMVQSFRCFVLLSSSTYSSAVHTYFPAAFAQPIRPQRASGWHEYLFPFKIDLSATGAPDRGPSRTAELPLPRSQDARPKSDCLGPWLRNEQLHHGRATRPWAGHETGTLDPAGMRSSLPTKYHFESISSMMILMNIKHTNIYYLCLIWLCGLSLALFAQTKCFMEIEIRWT